MEIEIEVTPEAIILWRLYDVMSVLLSDINPEKYAMVMQVHDQGLFVTPPPSYQEVPSGD